MQKRKNASKPDIIGITTGKDGELVPMKKEKMIEVMMVGEMMVPASKFKAMENKIIKAAKVVAKENYLQWDKRLEDFTRRTIRESQSEMIRLFEY